jgi:hypothetical protein
MRESRHWRPEPHFLQISQPAIPASICAAPPLIARVAAEATLSSGDLHGLRVQIVVESTAALRVLLVATAIGSLRAASRLFSARFTQFARSFECLLATSSRCIRG